MAGTGVPKEGRKHFFFEKKKQKTFFHLAARLSLSTAYRLRERENR